MQHRVIIYSIHVCRPTNITGYTVEIRKHNVAADYLSERTGCISALVSFRRNASHESSLVVDISASQRHVGGHKAAHSRYTLIDAILREI